MKTPWLWTVGIENTFVVGQERGERPLDEYELTGHYQNWREDLDRARDLGATRIRYGVPWYKLEPQQGQFDWTWSDEVMNYFVEHPDLVPIIDLIHYGTPLWLTDSFQNLNYPEAIAAFGKAFAMRYGHFIKWYTPHNEPFVTAQFCGLTGTWPPYLTGWQGFVRVMLQVARGIVKTVQEIRAVVPDSTMVHVEATKIFRPLEGSSGEVLAFYWERRLVMWELIMGHVDEHHVLYDWLKHNGATDVELGWFRDNSIDVDIMGVNYYSQFCVGAVSGLETDTEDTHLLLGSGKDLFEICVRLYQRYKIPLYITETSFRGDHNEREHWLFESVETAKNLVSSGVDLRGFTWFPFIDMADWDYRINSKPIEDSFLSFGLFDLKYDKRSSTFTRKLNQVGESFKSIVNTEMK